MLSGNRIGDAGVLSIADGLQFSHTLDWLDLRSNAMTPEGRERTRATHFGHVTHHVDVLL